MSALHRYKRDWPKRHALVARCLAAVERADAQFPEASCPIVSRLLCEVLPHCTLMCGRYESAGMERSRRHVWVFDMRASALARRPSRGSRARFRLVAEFLAR
jgi:hypothetical protein